MRNVKGAGENMELQALEPVAAEIDAVVNDFVSRYGFSRMRVINIIEKVFSEMLSRWHKTKVTTLYWDGNLRVFGYFLMPTGYREQKEIHMKKPNPQGWKTIKRMIEQQMRHAADRERYYQATKSTMLGWGIIHRIVPGEKLIVELTLLDQYGESFEVYAECPISRIGDHERRTGAFKTGARRAFWVQAIHPVTLGGTPRLNVMLNRTSRHLPAMLMAEMLGDDRATIRCPRRYPGQKSFLVANMPVPKGVILSVGKELSEHVSVQYIK